MSRLTSGLHRGLFGPDRPFIYYEGIWYSNHHFIADTKQLQQLLAGCGVRPGDRVLVGYPNSYAFAVLYYAILDCGATVVPLNPDSKPSELEAVLTRTQAQIGFFSWNLKPVFQDCLRTGETTGAVETMLFSDNLTSSLPNEVWTRRHRRWERQPMSVIRLDSIDTHLLAAGDHVITDDDTGVLMYTSGTTGRPKAVALKHRHLLAAAEQIVKTHQLTAEDVSFCFLPLFHINAQVVAVLSTWLSGGRLVIAERFSASRFWPTVTGLGVTWVSAVPTVIAILQNSDGDDVPPSHLRFIRSASAQLPHLYARRFERRFGVPVIQSYGMTEAASQICVNPLPPGERRSDSVGVPCGVELRIVDEAGDDMPVGRIGEVVLRGPSVIEAYEEAETQSDFRNGWFYTGDMGRMDNDGYVYLTGRKKELINRAGEKVSPYEVEDVIRAHPLVDQVAVIGLPDPLYGESVAAYITLKEQCGGRCDSTAAEIISLCQVELSRHKCPTVIEFVTELPVGPTGKVQRGYLKQQVLAARIS